MIAFEMFLQAGAILIAISVFVGGGIFIGREFKTFDKFCVAFLNKISGGDNEK